MFIHLGGDEVIRSKDVIAILDYNYEEPVEITEEFLAARTSENTVVISPDLTKSVVLTTDKVYHSPISSSTLKRRANVVSEFEDYSEEAKEDEET
ncbi:uncharacterized protein DUF370 [Salsuginibacillus halophilus]|uniref:Uncharacterized protein DUF370 n=1 Tax=Salsuginibacillus halophilus TaxID=517424 RepID=A0A2P8HIA4_9BACI|nr:extracellular matrix/biofilm biosynthesis regulator RemA family protein [Salsuginibacillus halophilus]PSL45946.1 uncharacterized protein DUF370 [Salsuginibacillus halophilus]